MTRKGYPEGYIGQHTLFERGVMHRQPTQKLWRNHPGMIVIMPEDDEKALHRELDGLPLPSKVLATKALHHLAVLPPTLGRVEAFNSVTNLMHDIAERQQDNLRGVEAALFAEHFENQRTFFSRALTKTEEDEVLATRGLTLNLAEHALSNFEDDSVEFTFGVSQEKKWGRQENEPSEHALLVDEEHGIFAVFDGVTEQGGRPEIAAVVARGGIIHSLSRAPEPTSEEEMIRSMKAAFDEARVAVMERGHHGATTATVAWHTRLDGQDYWVFGNAGDSRSFLYDKIKKSYRSITTNQAFGNTVSNSFKPAPFREFSHNDEFLVVPVEPSERLMICTDGITGDTADDELSAEEFITAFSKYDPQVAAEEFLELSTKVDDKVVIVVDID